MPRLLRLVPLLAAGCVPHLYSSGKGELPGGDWVAPTNGWPIGTPPSDLEATGLDPSDTVPDFRLPDQHGDEVSLWQFYGSVLIVDISTIWCGPCQDLAGGVQETAEAYADQGFVYVTVLQQDLEGDPPDRADLEEWADTFGIEAPILGDGDLQMIQAVKQGSYPALLLVDRDLRVVKRINPVTDDEIREQLDALLR